MKAFLRSLLLSNNSMISSSASGNQPEQQSSSQDPSTNPRGIDHDSLTVIELFQSQGCNSCPPTNDILLDLASSSASRRSNAILLTYHVTYWNHLGWKDTFGNRSFDVRQRDYVRRLALRSAFTPQVVINGRASGVGNTREELKHLLRDGEADQIAAVKIDINHERSSQDEIAVCVSALGIAASSHSINVWLVTYDPAMKNVYIRSGENRDKVLRHLNVVRSIKVLGELRGGEEGVFVVERERGGLSRIILVQDGAGGPILGALNV